MSTRKLCAHIIAGYSGPLGKPLAVKLVNASPAYVREVRGALGNGALIVVRWVEENPNWNDPERAAQDWYNRHLPDMAAMSGPEHDPNLCFEGLNEVPDDLASRYVRFEVARLGLMHHGGYRSVVGNFSVGTPDFPVWETYHPLLHAMAPDDWLGLHEYWSSRSDLDNPYHVGRWRKVPLLAAVPTLITECGRDVVEGQGKPGWQRTASAAEFLDDLRRYNALLESAPQVGAAFVFTLGNIMGWEKFGCNEFWPSVVAEYPVQMQPPPLPADPTAPGVRYVDLRYLPFPRSSRGGQPVRAIIVGDSEAAREDALAGWLNGVAATKGIAHDLIDEQGVVRHCVSYASAVPLAAASPLPGSTIKPEPVAISVSLEYPAAPAAPAWPSAQLAAAANHVRMLAATHHIGREGIYRRAVLGPNGYGGPRNLDWDAFLKRVFPQEDDNALTQCVRQAAWNAGGIPYTPTAAFPQFARAHNLGNPETPEFDFSLGGQPYRGQGFSKGIIYCRLGAWDQIKTLPW